jgi:hypothetical protein
VSLRALYHLARADFFERTRRYAFLVTVAGAVGMGYLVNAGYVTLSIADHRGRLNSAWVGTLIALTVSLFLTWFGFYLVKNAIERDRRTRVGEILAATPLTRFAYALGKTASNFAYLSVIVVILAAAGLLMQLLSGEDRRLDLAAFVAPMLWVALPPVALVSALAVLFENVRFLRGSFGNVLYFFAWTALIPIGAETDLADPLGMGLVQDALRSAYIAQASPPPAKPPGITFQMGPRREVKGVFTWEGIDWSGELIAGRAGYFLAALGVASLAALLFSRFDPAREKRPRDGHADGHGRVWRERRLNPLARWSPSTPFTTLVAAELRLMLYGLSPWWWLVALGLAVAGLLAPLEVGRGFLLPIAWLWPIALWSGLGNREVRYGAEQLVFSAPRPVVFHAAAIWTAGLLVTAAAGLPVGLRLLLAADGHGLLCWLVACLFIPSMAFALGSWSGSGRAFEILYLLLWYIGPINRAPGLDFVGAAPANATLANALLYLTLAAALAAAGWVGRKRLAEV